MDVNTVHQLEQKHQFYGELTLMTEGCSGLYIVWDKLKVGSSLVLGYSEKHEKIAVVYVGKSNEAEIIGYLPLPEDGGALVKILASGWIDLSTFMDCQIISMEERQIQVGIWIKEKP